MIPAYILLLLDSQKAEEFLYYDKHYISIKGTFINDEWVVDIRVNVLPHFAWGCNNYHTGMRGSFKSVVRYHLMDISNQLSECNAEGRGNLLKVIKGDL